jgi:type IV pilus assembly protein PilA
MNQNRRGFTLIELLIVVVVIGLLTAMALPKFAATKGKAEYAAMRSDLRNLVTAQESYFYDKSLYSITLDSLKMATSPGVTVTVVEATPSGWSATSTHPLAYPHFCSIYMGGAAPVAPATTVGVVACN